MNDLKAYLEINFIVFIWGFTAILGAFIVTPAVELVFFRVIITSLFIAGMIMLSKKAGRDFKMDWRTLLVFLLNGLIISLHWILFFGAIKVANVSICLAGLATVTIWTSFFEPLFHRRKIRGYEVLLGLVVLSGICIIFVTQLEYYLGLVMAIFSAMFSALFSVINSRLTNKHDEYVITFYEMVGAVISIAVFLPLYVVTLAPGGQLHLSPSGTDIWWIAVLAVVCTVYPFAASVRLMKQLSAFAVNLVINMEPIYGIALAIIIFNENKELDWRFYLGTGIIVSAVLMYPMIRRYERRKRLRAGLDAPKMPAEIVP